LSGDEHFYDPIREDDMDRAQPSLTTPNRSERLPESLDKRLLAYALAAGAGLAAAPELAQASIIYTNPDPDITKFNSNDFIDIDLNNDGTADARVTITKFYPYFDAAGVDVRVEGNAQPTGVIGGPGVANALLAGDPIGVAQSFQGISASSRVMASAYSYEGNSYPYYGDFANAGDRFLGLRFQINGADHFGWAQFNVTVSAASNGETFAEARVALLDYAYENCAAEGIQAGATPPGGASCPSGVPMPPALALVALGAGGLALWRARRRDGQ